MVPRCFRWKRGQAERSARSSLEGCQMVAGGGAERHPRSSGPSRRTPAGCQKPRSDGRFWLRDDRVAPASLHPFHRKQRRTKELSNLSIAGCRHLHSRCHRPASVSSDLDAVNVDLDAASGHLSTVTVDLERISGDSDDVSRDSEGVSGDSDDVSGDSDDVSGGSDDVSGGSEAVSGGSEGLSSGLSGVNRDFCSGRTGPGGDEHAIAVGRFGSQAQFCGRFP